jgi:hypothetical protein
MSDRRARPGVRAAAMDRREFIGVAGFAILAVHCLPATTFASDAPLDGASAADDLIIASGPGALHHVHYLRIPNALLATPPARGAALITTKALLHQHRIVLTQDELRRVDDGGTVTQRASSHVFVIARAKGITQPSA